MFCGPSCGSYIPFPLAAGQSCQPQDPSISEASGTGHHFSSHGHRVFPGLFFLCDLSSSSGLEFRPFFLKPAFSAFLSGNSVSSLASPPTFPFESVSARVSSVAHSWEPGLRHPCMALRYSLNSSAWHQSPL